MGKGIGATFAILIVVGSIAAYNYYGDIQSRKDSLEKARRSLSDAKSNVESQLGALESAKQKNQRIKEQVDSFMALTKSKLDLTNEVAALDEETKQVTSKFMEAVQRQRSASEGQTWPDVAMPSGQVLRGVTLQKLADNEVTLLHSGGLLKLSPTDLPDDIRRRFRYGMTPMTSAAAPAAAAPKPTMPVPAVAPAPTVTPDKAAALQQQIKILEDSRQLWVNAAEAHRLRARDAISRGRPSSTFTADAVAAENQVAAITLQIQKLGYQIRDILDGKVK